MTTTMYKKLADSTLYKMKKQEIIERLRCAEHNADAYKATLEQHITNVKDWVPVVRCKDCKRKNRTGFCTVHQRNVYGIAASWWKPADDYFCADGERCEER